MEEFGTILNAEGDVTASHVLKVFDPIARSQKTVCRKTRYSSADSTCQRWLAAGEQDHIQSFVFADDWKKEKNYSLCHSW